MTILTLHEYALSGNCYKIRLAAAHMGVALERRQYDILAGETRTLEFRTKINANGRIPVLQVGDRFLPESNAAAFWLADDGAHRLIPADRWDRADMLRWMAWEQYNHEPNIATLRFWRAFLGEEKLSDVQRAQIDGKFMAGHEALTLMNLHLAGRDWFAGCYFTLADIALYAYTHVAAEGGFDLSGYSFVRHWLDRVANVPGHIAITD
jgi:glutathione S-transferase